MPGDEVLNAADEADAYMRRYDDTVDALLQQRERFRDLAENSPLSGQRELAAAMAVEANRALEFLMSKHDAYVNGFSLVRRPTLAEVEAAEVLAQRLAKLAADQARTEGIIKLVAEAIDELNKVSDAA
jgi:hypothetical protein